MYDRSPNLEIVKCYDLNHIGTFYLNIDSEFSDFKSVTKFAIKEGLIPDDSEVYESGWGGGNNVYYAYGKKIKKDVNKCYICNAPIVNKKYYMECSDDKCNFRRAIIYKKDK